MTSAPRRNEERKIRKSLDAQRMKRSGAEDSGYHAPSPQDIRDIQHDHNTGAPGAVTADEAVRRAGEAVADGERPSP